MLPVASNQATFSCRECRAPTPYDAPSCPNCAYPYALVQGPRPEPEDRERTLWEGRASIRAALPAAVRTMFGAVFVVAGFEFVIRRLPGWLVSASAELGNTFDPAQLEPVLGWVRWAEWAILALLALRLVLTCAQVKRLHVRLTNQRLVRRWGLIARHVDELDLRLVNDVASRQSAFERIFGIGHLIISIDDPRVPRMDLRGLPDPNRLREAIRTEITG